MGMGKWFNVPTGSCKALDDDDNNWSTEFCIKNGV